MRNIVFVITVALLAFGSNYILEQFNERPGIIDYTSKIIQEGTSWSCSESSSNGQVCRFKNLCYFARKEHFVLFSSQCETQNIDEVSEMTLNLTSIIDLKYTYKAVRFPLSVIQNGKMRVTYREGKFLVFARFVMGNIYHFFHDEILPIYNTLFLQHELHDESSMNLLILDNGDFGSFADLYKMFTHNPILLRVDLELEEDDTLTCFEDAIVGLSKETVWFKYNFKSPEGPSSSCPATWEHIHSFTEYVKDKLAVFPNCYGEDYGIIFRRNSNRMILNEQDIINAVSLEFDLKLIVITLEETFISYIIEKASCAKLMIGIHGALLIFEMFLPPHAVFLEIFPYGINPELKSHFKTLAYLPGSEIEYIMWRNMDNTKTVTHPDNEVYFGGISYLKMEDQIKIFDSPEVSASKRVSHPEWRFRLYQDTIVDILDVIKLLNGTRLGSFTKMGQTSYFNIQWIYSSTVLAVKKLVKLNTNTQIPQNKERGLKTKVLTYGN